jgi:type IV secretory pathway VirB2 component (pilin)
MDMRSVHRVTLLALLALVLVVDPSVALAQESPFLTGANSLVDNLVAWATPIAILVVMVIGVMAMAGRASPGLVLVGIVGIAILFGAPQIVTWVRDMFAV